MEEGSQPREALLAAARYTNKHRITSRLVQYPGNAANMINRIFEKDETHLTWSKSEVIVKHLILQNFEQSFWIFYLLI